MPRPTALAPNAALAVVAEKLSDRLARSPRSPPVNLGRMGKTPPSPKRRRRRLNGRAPSRRRSPSLRFESVLSGKRVLVTGGAGFIGSHVVDQLVEAGCGEIVVLDNMSRGRPENLHRAQESGRVTLIVGDIRNGPLLSELVEGVDTVFHQAALRINHCAVEPRAAMEVMIDATFELLEQCVKSGVRKVIMASSSSVYGMANAFPTSEQQSPYANRTLYGAAKSFAEALLRSFHEMYGLNYVALRYFSVFGPRMDLHGRHAEVLTRWMERLAAGQPPIIFGNGSQTMDLLHVADVARANILAATCDATDVCLNIGSGQETSMLLLARHLAQVMKRPDVEPVFWEEQTANPVPRGQASTVAARRTLGFETTVPLAEGLAGLVEWWREHARALAAHKIAG